MHVSLLSTMVVPCRWVSNLISFGHFSIMQQITNASPPQMDLVCTMSSTLCNAEPSRRGWQLLQQPSAIFAGGESKVCAETEHKSADQRAPCTQFMLQTNPKMRMRMLYQDLGITNRALSKGACTFLCVFLCMPLPSPCSRRAGSHRCTPT